MNRHFRRFAPALLSTVMLCTGSVLAQSDAPPPPPPGSPSDAPPPPPPGGPHRGGREHRIEMLQHHLNLTSDQTTQVKGLFETERTKMEALRSNSTLAPADRHTEMMAIHQDTDTKLRALLTPDQVSKYDSMEARMQERRQNGQDGQGPPPPPPGPGAQ